MQMQVVKYQSHKIGYQRNDKPNILNNCNKPDRNYMEAQLKVHYEYFDEHGIMKYSNFTHILRKYEFKSDDERLLMKKFQEYKLSQDPLHPIFLLKPREFKKANSDERNILMNRIAHEYSFEFLRFFEIFIQENYNFIKKQQFLIEEIKLKIEEVLKEGKDNKEIREESSTVSSKEEIKPEKDEKEYYESIDFGNMFDTYSNQQAVNPYEEFISFPFDDTYDNYFEDITM